MIAAHGAGIPIFVTGGIGGVHRGGEHSKWVQIDSYRCGTLAQPASPVLTMLSVVRLVLSLRLNSDLCCTVLGHCHISLFQHTFLSVFPFLSIPY